MDVVELLKRTATWWRELGIESARLDAEVLLGHVLGLSRLQLYTSFDRPLGKAEVDTFRELARRRARREPVAYILGEREFHSRPFLVDRRVLIPRPETEELVDLVLRELPPAQEGERPVVVDWGTGSGCIAITLVLERPDLRILALDRSREALAVAKANAEKHGVASAIGFVVSDGFERIPGRFLAGVAAIVANPPYVAESERAAMAADVLDWEPHEALFPGPDPVAAFRRIAADAPTWLRPDGLLAVENGRGQGEEIGRIFRAAGLLAVRVVPDLSRVDRFVLGRRPGPQVSVL